MDRNYLATEANEGSLTNYKLLFSHFNDIPPHRPPLQVSSTSKPRIQNDLILFGRTSHKQYFFSEQYLLSSPRKSCHM